MSTNTLGWAKEEEPFLAGMGNVASSSSPADEDKLAPPLRSKIEEFKAKFLAGEILLSHKRNNEYLEKTIRGIGYDKLLKTTVTIKGVESDTELIAIPGLLKFTGLPAHVGLGRYYGKPVIYIDSDLYYNEDIRQHETDEVMKWETLRNLLKLEPREMRKWILDNIETPVNDEKLPPEYRSKTSSQIAEIIHKESHRIDGLYKLYANTVDYEYLAVLTAYDDEVMEYEKDVTIAAHKGRNLTASDALNRITELRLSLTGSRRLSRDQMDDHSRELVSFLAYKDGRDIDRDSDVRDNALRAVEELFKSPRDIPPDIIVKRMKELVDLIRHYDRADRALNVLFKSSRDIPQDALDGCARELVSLMEAGGHIPRTYVQYDLEALFASPRKISQDVIDDCAIKLADLLGRTPDSDSKRLFSRPLEALFASDRHLSPKALNHCARKYIVLLNHRSNHVRTLAISALGTIVSRQDFSITGLKKAISRQVRLSAIRFADGGDSPNSSSFFAEGLLRNLKNSGTSDPPKDLPVRQGLVIGRLPKADLSQVIPRGYAFLRAQGRTLIFVSKTDNKYIAIKLLKDKEDPSLLDYESRMFDYINDNRNVFDLKGTYPVSHSVKGSRVIRIKTDEFAAAIRKGLDAHTGKDGEPFTVDRIGGYYTAMAYEITGAGYFTYLSDAAIEEGEFRKAMLNNIHDLFSLARHGIIHTALIELFHNVIQGGREDRGKYLWMVDIIRPMASRTGAGRLHAWTRAVQYPNVRLSGIADLPDLYHIKDLAKEYGPASIHLATLRERHPDYNPEVFYLASYLGDYLLSVMLTTGRYLRDRDQLDYNDTTDLAGLIRDCYAEAYSTFTGQSLDEIKTSLSGMIDWDRMAKQMAFFMAKGDIYANYLIKEYLPRGLYEDGARIEYSPDRVRGVSDYSHSRGWVNGPNKRGWYFDGVNPDLGPVNGPNPLQELIKANYLATSFMLHDLAHQSAQRVEAIGPVVSTAKGSPAACLETITLSANLFAKALDTEKGISVAEVAETRSYSSSMIYKEFEILKELGILVSVVGSRGYYRFSDMMIGSDENYTKTLINAINDIRYQVGKKGEERPMHRWDISDDKLGVVKELVKMTILHQINYMQKPTIPEGKVLWHILERDVVAVSQQSSFAQEINNAAERSKASERIYILKRDESIEDAISRLSSDHPDAIFDIALSAENHINRVPGDIKRLVFKGSAGDVAQLEGVVAALRALHGPKEDIIPTLKRIYAVLKGASCQYEIPPDALDDPVKFARSFIFDLPPATPIPANEISKMNERLMQLLTAA